MRFGVIVGISEKSSKNDIISGNPINEGIESSYSCSNVELAPIQLKSRIILGLL
jgi:hypothetical protein